MTTRTELQPGTEPFVIHTYRVLLMANKYDKDEGRFDVTVRASGPMDARYQALEQSKTQYPAACVLRTPEAID